MATWQKLVIVVAAAVGSVFGWRAIRSALASDEQQIVWVFEDMQRGFNDTRMAPVLGGFANAYRDESSGITRQELREVLTYLFLRVHDPETKRFRLRMELDADALQVAVDEGAGTAQVSGTARFFDHVDGVDQLFWDARFDAELASGSEGWQVVRTTQVNVADIADLD